MNCYKVHEVLLLVNYLEGEIDELERRIFRNGDRQVKRKNDIKENMIQVYFGQI